MLDQTSATTSQLHEQSHLVVVLVTPAGPGSGGGAQQVLRRMIPQWVADGHPITLLTHPVDERWDGLAKAVEVVPLPGPSPQAMRSTLGLVASFGAVARAAWTIRRTVRSRPGAVVLPFLPGTAILTLLATWGLDRRVVPCERNDPTRQRLHAAVKWARRLLYRRASAVTVNTGVAQEAFQRLLLGSVPVHLVANPLPDWPAPDPTTPREHLIVSVGRLVPQKRHDDVIRAFARIAPDHPSWRLEIVGEGPEREHLARLATELSITPRIDLVGHMNDVRPTMLRARVLVLASEFEGTPNVVLEGLLAGLHVVVSDAVPPLPATLDPRDALKKFPVTSVNELVAQLAAMLGENSKRAPYVAGLSRFAKEAAASWRVVTAPQTPETGRPAMN